MTPKTPESKPLLAPIANRYKPSEADFERILSKVQTSLATPATAPARTSTRIHVAKWIGLSLVGLSCSGFVAYGIVARGILTRSNDHAEPTVSTLAPRTAGAPLDHGAPRAKAEGDGPTERTRDAVEVPESPRTAESVDSVAVDALPKAPVPTKSSPSPQLRAGPVNSNTASRKPAGDDTLAREARLLAEAESAFRRGDDARALASLAEHERQFPHGLLEDERTAERIIVLCHAGRREEAASTAKPFLRNHAPDPLTRRIAVSCAGSFNEDSSETP